MVLAYFIVQDFILFFKLKVFLVKIGFSNIYQLIHTNTTFKVF